MCRGLPANPIPVNLPVGDRFGAFILDKGRLYRLIMHSDNHSFYQETIKNSLTIAVIGDIHDQWEKADERALQHLGVDLVLFVGDYGNEAVSLVRSIAQLDIPKAAVFGNHDAWYTMTDWGRRKCPYNREKEDWVNLQMEALSDCHVGYSQRTFPQFQLAVVGTRPFSWGGPEWKHASFYQERFGVHNLQESTDRIVAAAQETPVDTVLFLGHNGPYGLGSQPEAPCGKDWKPIGGDYGDPDFSEAIAQTRALGKTIPLVTFGHMHHRLRHTNTCRRQSLYVDGEGTVYLNAASVPRIVDIEGDRCRNFSLITLRNGRVAQASLVWVGEDFQIVSEEILHQNQNLCWMQSA
jgi:uncharacterized protein (TIGR04168 family)